jgi:hypothetical protein
MVSARGRNLAKAVACLTQDSNALLVFYTVPESDWRRVRTTEWDRSTNARRAAISHRNLHKTLDTTNSVLMLFLHQHSSILFVASPSLRLRPYPSATGRLLGGEGPG